ncbi:MAG: flagellar basal body rod protein FlgB [Planctomycetota bacterium]|jgi:flagellar basal-body rod protein FlgB|nr:flagellar basal body rod protein FlgB [Planctomycetota bacterium]MEC8509978.1 flagellar basal body rod protein FlgB [Planctomycetota bacterium]MEC8784491.1 flagellar basal body rod protein FlgB [Planctomycetota bacterium]MEE3074387.1 flagellar basal body rod protein FlgB [Planctomycetota bacterium]
MQVDLMGQTSIPVLEQVLNFTQTRHAVLAGNVANMDTPGYQTRDLSVDEFQTRLREAIDQRVRRSEGFSDAETIDLQDDGFKRVADSMKDILHHDESNVSLEQQVLQVNKNQGLHNLAVAILNQQFRQMNVAISERV